MRIEDNFKWFTGVVEDRNDPEKLNRVRVRIFGAHTQDKTRIATADLPWAAVMMPTTSSSNSGLGLTLHGLVEGSWVVGFWKDGGSKQDPMIMGSFVGQNSLNTHVIKNVEGRNSDVTNLAGLAAIQDSQRSRIGFVDPRIPAVANYGDTPEGINPSHNPTRSTGLTLDLDHSPKKDGYDAVNYPREDYLEQSDVNKLGRADGIYDMNLHPNWMIENDPKLQFSEEDRGKWVHPKYPFNHVYESESGHVIEIDDTPDYERINIVHRKGARIEINNEGEIHIIAASGQDVNIQGKDINLNDYGDGTLNINSFNGKINVFAKLATKITSQGPTDIVSSGITKIFSMLDTKIASIGKNIIG
jgi:hypothetical protein|tara:strand:+ start:2756 stop:3829 length:1074 start_codon:yes stop_codon:yes gene_type:complete